MFSEDYQLWDATNLTFLPRDEARTVYATKSEIPTLSGGLDVTLADTRYAPKTGSTVYAAKTEIPDISGKANVTDVAVALSGKAEVSHHHDTAYAPVTGSTVYATKDEVVQATGGGITQTMADARYVQQTVFFQGVTDIGDVAYAPMTGSTVYATTTDVTDLATEMSQWAPADRSIPIDIQFAPAGSYATTTDVSSALIGKSDTTHTHTGVYQPVGSYLVAADINGKADTSAVTSALTLKANVGDSYTKTESDAKYLTTDDDSVYQTKANMVVVGSETTYYSGAKVDALLLAAMSGGGSSSSTSLYLTSPNKATFNPAWAALGPGFFWQVRSNTTPFTPVATTSIGVSSLFNVIHNRTTDTYRVRVDYQVNSFVPFTGTPNTTAVWMVHLQDVPVDAGLEGRVMNANDDSWGFKQSGDGTGVTRIGANGLIIPNFPAKVFTSRANSNMFQVNPVHVRSATFVFGPNDLLVVRCWYLMTAPDTGMYDHVPCTCRDGYVNEWYVEAVKI